MGIWFATGGLRFLQFGILISGLINKPFQCNVEKGGFFQPTFMYMYYVYVLVLSLWPERTFKSFLILETAERINNQKWMVESHSGC